MSALAGVPFIDNAGKFDELLLKINYNYGSFSESVGKKLLNL